MERNNGEDESSTQDWGAMGGSPGDGFAGQNYTSPAPPMGTVNYQSPMQQQHQAPPSTTGSITRFATPEMGASSVYTPIAAAPAGSSTANSYAARSQQAYVSYGQQQATYANSPAPQSLPMPARASYAGAQPSQNNQASNFSGPQTMASYGSQQQGTAVTTAAGSTYAARSQQAYAQQIPQQAAPSGVSYAARSQQAYGQQPSSQQQQQQQQVSSYGSQAGLTNTAPYHAPSPTAQPTGSYTSRSQHAYGQQQQSGYLAPVYGSQPQQQVYGQQSYISQQQPQTYAAQQPPASYAPQQEEPQPYVPQRPQLSPQSAATPTAGSYAARSSAQSFGATQEHSHGYTQRSAQAYGGDAHSAATATMIPSTTSVAPTVSTANTMIKPGAETPQAQAMQQRLLTDATRKVQEHAYYMRQAMDQKNLPVMLDRAAHMVGELGGLPHGHHHPNTPSTNSVGGYPTNTGASVKLSPKNYYELYMRALEDMPNFEEYLLNLSKQRTSDGDIAIVDTTAVRRKPYTMMELYDCVKYCPRVVSRLYLQISAGSALIRSGEAGAKWVMQELSDAVKCEQNPIRGLFLRHNLLQVLRDKLPDEPDADDGADALIEESKVEDREIDPHERGTVKDSYKFIIANFMEMNKLWVRIQHLPGDNRSKDVRKRRERERNDLRILVGTNLVRLSQLECVSSKIYGEAILPQILEHIVTCGDPLSQAYVMDCLVQVFPDEYHIETMPILLNVCPRLRDKVNIRTIIQGLMDRLANYLAEEELLDESDTNEVKKTLARDAFGMFEECVEKVYNARGPKLTAREVIRLQTALLQFSVKMYQGNIHQISRSLGVCVAALRQANASYEIPEGTVAVVPHDKLVIKSLDEVATAELEKLLSIPLDTLALKVLDLEHYDELVSFLPWANRAQVATSMLEAIDRAGAPPNSLKEIESLFSVIEPIIRDDPGAGQPAVPHHYDPTAHATTLLAQMGVSQSPAGSFGASFHENDASMKSPGVVKENALVSKLVQLLDHDSTDIAYEMLEVARKHIAKGGSSRYSDTLESVVFSSLRLVKRISDEERVINLSDEKMNEQPVQAVNDLNNPKGTEDYGEGNPIDKADTEVPLKKEPNKDAVVQKEAEDTFEKDLTLIGTEEPSEKMESAVDLAVVNSANAEEQIAADLAAANSADAEEQTALNLDAADQAAADSADAKRSIAAKSAEPKLVSCRKVFVFIQESITLLSATNPEVGVKLSLEVAVAADSLASAATEHAAVTYEMLTQAFGIYEERIADSKAQHRCIGAMIGTLLSCKSISKDDYEGLITKTTQFAAKVLKKPDQCQLVAMCAYLFYPGQSNQEAFFSNPQRALECLQRSLKLADSCTSANPSHIGLFVDLLEHYVSFFERGNSAITSTYISGLVALCKEHLNTHGGFGSDGAISEAKSHFVEVVASIKRKKTNPGTAERFGSVQIDNLGL